MNRDQRSRRAAVRAPASPSSNMPGLLEAAACLDALADGRQPDLTSVIVGALALDALRWTLPGRDLLDAAQDLAVIPTGGVLDLDEAGRFRARQLANAVRASAGRREPEDLPATSRASHHS
jgi:hypothetical protein